MKDYASKMLSKALDAIESAEALQNIDKHEFAAGRAYYAMFYVAEALLYNEFDLKLNQHVRSLRRMERILQRQRRSIPNITAGCEMDLTNESSAIMGWIRESAKALLPI